MLSRGCRVHKGSGPGCGGLRFSGLGCWCFGFLGFRVQGFEGLWSFAMFRVYKALLFLFLFGFCEGG